MATAGTAPAATTEKDVQVVKMKDGRSVEFPGKRRLQKTVTADSVENVQVRLDFVNGETFTCKLPPGLVAKAAGHGLSQKLGDEISGVKDIDDAVEAVDDLIGRIAKGDWNEQATGGEGLAGASVLMRALMEVSKKSREDVKAFLSSRSAKEKAALRETSPIKEVVQRLEAEKAARGGGKAKDATPIDTQALLGQLTSGARPANSAFAQGQATIGGDGATAKASPTAGTGPATTATAQPRIAPKDASGKPAAKG